MSKVAGPVIRKRGLAEARIVTDWPKIVGAQVAACTCPEKLAPGSDGVDGTLHIRVAGGWATELQHLEPVFVEKVNAYFGYKAVSRLRLQQGPLPESYSQGHGKGQGRRGAELSTESPPLAPSEQEKIDAAAAEVTDPEIREALAAFGAALAVKDLKKKDNNSEP